MHKELVKNVYGISKKSGSDKIVVLTNHIKISGTLCNCEDQENAEGLISLTNASIWLLDDLCKCGDDDCKCSTAKIYHAEWLNINAKKVVAFSIIK